MKILPFLFLVLVFSEISAQRFIDKRIKVLFSGGTSSGIGNAVYVNNDYKSPSLINNFKTGTSFGITASYKVRKIWGINLRVAKTTFEEWTYPGSTRYRNSKFSALTLNPQLAIVTPFKEKGIWNRVNVSGFIGPSLNLYSLVLSTPPYTSPTPFEYDFQNSKSFGIGAGIEADVILRHGFFIGLCYTVDHQWVPSTAFEANTIQYGTIGFHVGFRYGNNKRYKYQPQWFE